MTGQWTYNTDKDYWDNENYDSKELAIEAGRENIQAEDPDYFNKSTHFRVGRVEPLAMRQIDANDMILEKIANDLMDDHEQAGMNAFVEVTNAVVMELENQLQHVFDEWMKKYECDPTKGYFIVTDEEDVTFQAEK